MTDSGKNEVINAWRTAARELGIDVVAPFFFEVDGRRHECLAWLPKFGGKKGILLVATHRDDVTREISADAVQVGYQLSALDLQWYSAFRRDAFMEALADWGFSGPVEERPIWFADAVAIEEAHRALTAYTRAQHWQVANITVGPDVAVSATGQRIISVNVSLRDGSQRYLEYRCESNGVGQLSSVECP